MGKYCPKCGKEVPDDAKFCMECGNSFEVQQTNAITDKFDYSKLFLIAIAAILIIGAAFILTSGNGGSDNTSDDVEHVDLTITGVSGYDSNYDGKTSYTIYTYVLFLDVPSDMNGYIIKTSYCDENDTVLGSETEKLSNVYYDTDYSISIGDYTYYKELDLDHVNVEIIKGGKTVDNFTSEIDKNKIDFLN